MPSALNNLKISQLAIDAVSWTAIAPPIDCDFLFVQVNGSASVKIRTDSADAATEKTILAGQEWSPASGGGSAYTGTFARFKSGKTVAFAQAVSGTGPLVITGLR